MYIKLGEGVRAKYNNLGVLFAYAIKERHKKGWKYLIQIFHFTSSIAGNQHFSCHREQCNLVKI